MNSQLSPRAMCSPRDLLKHIELQAIEIRFLHIAHHELHDQIMIFKMENRGLFQPYQRITPVSQWSLFLLRYTYRSYSDKVCWPRMQISPSPFDPSNIDCLEATSSHSTDITSITR